MENKRYIIYWPYSNADDLQGKLAKIKKIESEKNEIDSRTIDVINAGEQQPENDHNFKGEQTENGLYLDRAYRNAKAWFSYVVNNTSIKGNKLHLIVNGVDKNKNFDIYINDVLLTKVIMDGAKGNDFYAIEVSIPTTLVSETMEVKFVAQSKATTANIYEIRLMK
jgi:hypothetical protein